MPRISLKIRIVNVLKSKMDDPKKLTLCQKLSMFWNASAAQTFKEFNQVEIDFTKIEYQSTLQDMSNAVLQYGYITFFIVCCPITPLLALINNYFVHKITTWNLVTVYRRTHPRVKNLNYLCFFLRVRRCIYVWVFELVCRRFAKKNVHAKQLRSNKKYREKLALVHGTQCLHCFHF